MIKKTSILLLIFINCLHKANCQTDCELKKSKDSIFIYSCKVSASNLKLIKANFTINTKESILAAHLLDVVNYTQWQYHNVATRVLKKISDSEIIYHSEVAAPWPVTNRDLVMHLKISQDIVTKVMTIEIDGVPDFIPKQKNFVRVPSTHAKWIVTPINQNRMKVNYTLLIDPGGIIPAWIINMTLAAGPYETFRNIKERIKTTYDIVPASFIVD